MNRSERFHGLQCNDQRTTDKNVDLPRPDQMAFILNTNVNLAAESHSPHPEFHAQRFLIDRFEIARTERAMYLDGCTNDVMDESL